MGTTRIKVIDLSSDQKEIKTARKHAEKLTQAAKLKGVKGMEGKEGREGEEGQEGQISVTPASAESTKVDALIENKEPRTQEVTKSPDSKSASATSVKPKVSSAVAKKPSQKVGTRHKGKNYLDAQTLVDKTKTYSIDEALEVLPKISFTKFDPTVEVHINVIDKNIRGSLNLPHPFSEKKEKTILLFSDKQPAIDDKRILWGDETTIEKIEKGMLKPNKDFDIVYAAPKFMPQLAKVAKVLGPAGMMPNPKNGTISDDFKNALAAGQSTSFEYRTEPAAPVIHTKVGKLSAKPEALKENLTAIILAIGPAKITKATLKSTMSPPLKLDIPSVGR